MTVRKAPVPQGPRGYDDQLLLGGRRRGATKERSLSAAQRDQRSRRPPARGREVSNFSIQFRRNVLSAAARVEARKVRVRTAFEGPSVNWQRVEAQGGGGAKPRRMARLADDINGGRW